MKNKVDVCPVCGEKMQELKLLPDLKKGFRVCPVGFGTCDVGVDECNPAVERFGYDFAVSLKCPHFKFKSHRH